MTEYERFREDGESKFNKSLDDLKRISRLQDMANYWSCQPSLDGRVGWMNILAALDRELSPYLNTNEENALKSLRVLSLPDNRYQKLLGNTPSPQLTAKLDLWERKLRELISSKGMGLVAKDTDQIFILPGAKK